MQEYYEVIKIVFIHAERLYGSVESLGLYASKVKYQKDGIEIEINSKIDLENIWK